MISKAWAEYQIQTPAPVVVDVTTLKMARKPVKLQKKIQQDALREVNRMKEISRREKDCLKITDNKHCVRKKVSRVASVR